MIVPLLCREPLTSRCEALLRNESRLVVWWGTHTECVSALVRKAREPGASRRDLQAGLRRLEMMAGSWEEVQPGADMRRVAARLLNTHALRTADALQLAAALMACGHEPQRLRFVCADERLRTAAEKEGFSVLP